jgi:hypothetical protein
MLLQEWGYAKALPSKTFQEGGIYYPATLMYTLPKEPNCVCSQSQIWARQYFGGLPMPRPMSEVAHQEIK